MIIKDHCHKMKYTQLYEILRTNNGLMCGHPFELVFKKPPVQKRNVAYTKRKMVPMTTCMRDIQFPETNTIVK